MDSSQQFQSSKLMLQLYNPSRQNLSQPNLNFAQSAGAVEYTDCTFAEG